MKQCDHTALLDEVQKPEDVRISIHLQTAGKWSLTVAAMDQQGLLSVIAGLLAAWGITIFKGYLATHSISWPAEPASLHPEGNKAGNQPSTARARKILDTFVVSGNGMTCTKDWDAFAAELKTLLEKLAKGERQQVRQEIIDRICTHIKKKSEPREQLLPVNIEIDNRACVAKTVVRILSKDTPGFLFSFANALALMGINIEEGEILTIGTEVRDTFWVLDSQGQKITDKERIHQLRAACALIKQFTYMLPISANPGQALRQFENLVEQVLSQPGWAADLGSIHSNKVLDNLAAIMGVSQFLWEDFLRMQHENLFPMISNPEKLEGGLSKTELLQKLHKELTCSENDDEQAKTINAFKDRQMFRIDLRHITGHSSDDRFSDELTDLTDVVVEKMMELGFSHLAHRYGQPISTADRQCRWGVLSAGKFGGREMGFASDIELLIVYEGSGQTDGEKPLDNSLFFEKLVRFLLRNLKARQEGIFQVDLQLRPYGNRGALAFSLGAFKEYYSAAGPARQFERMALVKLRPVTGDKTFLNDVIAARNAFVYSGDALDYDNIRCMRQRQIAELVTPKTINVKLSPGGLVDIEYFIQARQIETGAKNEKVRVTNSMEALTELEKAGALPPAQCVKIRQAYCCLRRTINALRAVRGNARDLTIPDLGSPALHYLARRLSYAGSELFLQELQRSISLGKSLWEQHSAHN